MLLLLGRSAALGLRIPAVRRRLGIALPFCGLCGILSCAVHRLGAALPRRLRLAQCHSLSHVLPFCSLPRQKLIQRLISNNHRSFTSLKSKAPPIKKDTDALKKGGYHSDDWHPMP